MRRPTPLVSFALLAAGCLLSFGCGPIGTVRHLPRDAGAQGDEGGADGSAEGTDAGEWESTDWLCSDGIDNDGNGHTDCDDWRCCEESVPKAGITVCEVGTCRAKGAGRLDASSSPGPDAQSDTTLDADTIEVADAGSQEMPDVGSPAGLDAASLSGPDAATVAVNCSAIEAASSDWEVCETGANRCAGVFNDGAGCEAFCAAAGMICSASFGGEPGCQKESAELGCGGTGHQSDWCECVVPQGGIPDAGGPCPRDPANPPRRMELKKGSAVYTQRHNWVVDCSLHAYTASSSEHESCDDQYNPDGSRRGTATLTFTNVPPGRYDVSVESKHSENRNAAGALFYVNAHSKIINQRTNPGNYIWDLHGRYCLEGQVTVVLDSTVNGGSDAISAARLVPAP